MLRILFVLILLTGLVLFLPASVTSQACSSPAGCYQCGQAPDGYAFCDMDEWSGFCDCSQNVERPYICSLKNVCTYSGGGWGGGGGGACTIQPAEFCPTECPNCTVQYY